jgi:hypothetical protein
LYVLPGARPGLRQNRQPPPLLLPHDGGPPGMGQFEARALEALTPNTDNCFSRSSLSHAGHAGRSEPRTYASKR